MADSGKREANQAKKKQAVKPRPTRAQKVKAKKSAPPLSSHRRKLAHADTHIKEIERLVKAWVTDKSVYKIAVEPNRKAHIEVFGEQLKPLPNDLELIIGDALQAMRTSLDHLAFALAIKNKPTLTANEEKDVSFPIFDVPTTPGNKSVKHMSSSVIAKVIGLCPDPAVSPIQDHPLWLLNKANNRDKHRTITVAAVSTANVSQNLKTGIINGPAMIGIGGPKRTKRVGDRVLFSTFGPGSQVQVQIGAALQIIFNEGVEVADREVVSTLRWFHDHIDSIVFKRLEKHL